MMNDELKPPRKARPGRSRQFIIHNSSFSIFKWPVRVYYEDTDSGGVVYYANYLKYLERARTEWLRALGIEQTALSAVHRVAFVVRSISLEYLKPARLNDALDVTVEPVEIGASRIELAQRVSLGAQELVCARVVIACINTEAFKPVRIPSSLSDSLRRQAANCKNRE